MICDCTDPGLSTRITRFPVNGCAFPEKGARVGPGVFQVPIACCATARADAAVRSPIRMSVVFLGEYIALCHAMTSSRVIPARLAAVPAEGREYAVAGSKIAMLKTLEPIPSTVDWLRWYAATVSARSRSTSD